MQPYYHIPPNTFGRVKIGQAFTLDGYALEKRSETEAVRPNGEIVKLDAFRVVGRPRRIRLARLES